MNPDDTDGRRLPKIAEIERQMPLAADARRQAQIGKGRVSALRSPFIVASRVALRDGRGARKGSFFSLPTLFGLAFPPHTQKPRVLGTPVSLAFRVGYIISHLAVL
jgi:hypothetical protein